MAVFRALAGASLLVAICSTQASCDAKDATCANSASSASLLQKDFRRDGKNTLDEEKVLQPQAAPCTGTTMQGRCWHLSEMNEDCATTCAKYNRVFSYVVADEENPITPFLVGHIPKQKQQAWAALECYVASEDRYHTANPNAAKHMVDDISAWKYEECKLACPCGLTTGSFPVPPPVAPSPPLAPVPTPTDGQCSWKQAPACVAEFKYKGLTYHGCATVDGAHERPWCQHHADEWTYSGPYSGPEQDWSYCSYDCGAPLPTPAPVIPVAPVTPDKCSWTPAYSCAKEFDYEGTHYIGCTSADHGTPWCSNDSPYKGSWNNCVYSCANQDDVVPPSTEKLCRWVMKPECSSVFKYKGTDYSTCSVEDNPTPWCSYDRIHKGEWTTCTKICDEASGHVLPPASPTTSACDTYDGDWTNAEVGTISLVVSGSTVTAVLAGVSYTGTLTGNTITWGGSMTGLVSTLANCQITNSDGRVWTRPVACNTFAGQWTQPEQGTITITLSGSTAIGVLNGVTFTGTVDGTTLRWAGDAAGLVSTLTNCQIRNSDGKVWLRPQAPAPAPLSTDPCARRPEVDNDILGNSVTLDEAGYKIAASDDSPVNMKRFICRVVDKIDCQVADAQSLGAFIPFYSGLVTQQTYSHLHNELTTLCHTPGKWVVPK